MKWVLACLLSLSPAFASEQRPTLFATKPFGILLLYEGSDPVWETTVAAIRQKMGIGFPLKPVAGLGDQKALQKGVASLRAERVEKIVVVPLFLFSFSDIMKQNRYLLGLSLKPPREHGQEPQYELGFAGSKPVENSLPLVMTKALDDNPILGDILAARAKSLSRDAAHEAVVLIGEPPTGKDERGQWETMTAALARQVRLKGGFQSVTAAALPINLRQTERESAETRLRRQIKALRAAGPPIVVPLELTRGPVSSRIPKALDGLFIKYNGKSALPDSRIVSWAQSAAREGAGLADMRVKKASK